MSGRRIGVYVCGCGGNISDYVSIDDVVTAVKDEPDVVVARTAMFTCSDTTQQEIIQDIEEQQLDGIVVASCSPKLHTFTFREMSKRAGLNPYEYTQVNIREQCSWTHTDDTAGATEKAARLVRAGIARTRLTEPLEPIVVETVPKAVVIGGGIAGLRAALGLAEIGIAVFVVEKEPELGGWVGGFGEMYPHGKNGRELVAGLVDQVRGRSDITIFTDSEVVGKSGSFGNYEVAIRVNGASAETLTVQAGSIVVATGFDSYAPEPGEFGYGLEGVVTLPEFKRLLDASEGPLEYAGRPVRSIVYIYCVGSRQSEGNEYCSRYCCTAAVHASL
ncbi:MAG: CoB--CoM heterodisulfide reductase iron-sulfur subunit A family protein, partial [Actinobacteria bacterium]|nr:CoB--CoM heterodisulfide reductase iron-sulfur subunit A family protein [Actinomycetota bacterium]